MQYVADAALTAHGADDSEAKASPDEPVGDEESTYVVELPTLSVEASLGRAVDLGLRPDPDRPPAAACEKITTLLRGPAPEPSDDSGWERFAAWADRTCHDALPILTWLPKTSRDTLKADAIAGLTVGVMVIPQSMSYASIAGLELVYGLYASTVPALVYAFSGASGQLAVGPVALVSLLVEAGLQNALTKGECPEYYEDDDDAEARRMLMGDDSLAGTCPDEYAELVFVTMFFVGIIQAGGALLRMGFLINFLGHPVISGFTSGAAIIIGLSQVKFWLGVSVPKSQYVHDTVGAVFGQILKGNAKWMCLVLGIASYYALKAVKELATRRPKRFGALKPLGPLIVSALSLTIMIIWGDTLRDDYGVEVIGAIPAGLPPFTLPKVLNMAGRKFSTVLPTVVPAALIGFMESIAIGKSLAAKHDQELPAGRELGALGAANLIGSFFSGYPVAGSFSRSAVANSTGARSPLAGLITGSFVLLALVVLPPWVRKLPKFVLASIVISSVVNLVAIGEAKHLWHVQKRDFFLWVLAFLGTLFLGVLFGLLVAVGASLIIVLYESVRPQIAVLWKLPGTAIYRNVKQGESPGQFVRGVLVLRVGASMYFANVAYIKDTVIRMALETPDTQYVVIEMTPVTSLDSTALHMLEDLVTDMRRKGCEVCLASCGSRVEDTLRKGGVQRKIGYEWFHANVNSAVEFCVRHAAAHKIFVRATSGHDEEASGVLELSSTPGIRRRGSNQAGLDKETTKSVLVLAAKHRVVEGAASRLDVTPEQRAVAELDDAGEETKATPLLPPPPGPAAPPTPPSSERRRQVLLALRQVVRQNGGASGGNHTAAPTPDAAAPPTIVALPDPDAPDRLLLVAADVGDRPGVMRDISDVLATALALQVRYTEAAVVGSRSVTFWRCEVAVPGADRVADAARRAEDMIPKAL